MFFEQVEGFLTLYSEDLPGEHGSLLRCESW